MVIITDNSLCTTECKDEVLQPEGSIKRGSKAEEWMSGYVVEAQKVLHEVAVAGWNYVTSVSHLTKQLLDEAEEVSRCLFMALSTFLLGSF